MQKGSDGRKGGKQWLRRREWEGRAIGEGM